MLNIKPFHKQKALFGKLKIQLLFIIVLIFDFVLNYNMKIVLIYVVQFNFNYKKINGYHSVYNLGLVK